MFLKTTHIFSIYIPLSIYNKIGLLDILYSFAQPKTYNLNSNIINAPLSHCDICGKPFKLIASKTFNPYSQIMLMNMLHSTKQNE